MKILSAFESISALVSASGAAAGFPASNVAALDPGAPWQANAFSGDVWLKISFAGAKSLTALFLNRANFASCTIQGHASDSWGSPSFSLSATLAQDECGNRKGWFDLSAFNYQYLRVLIPAGTALDSGTVPQLGNLIVGTSAALPLASDLTVDLVGRVERFESDGGNVAPNFRGVQRHALTLTFGDTLANVKAVPKTWQHAVVYDELGSAAGAWLVFRPERWNRGTKNPIDNTLRVQLEERV